MKFTLASAALASVALAEVITFSAESSDGAISGSLSSIHEGAGFNYFLIGELGEKFNLTNNVASASYGGYDYNVGSFGAYLASGPAVTPTTLSLDGNTVTNNNFWACKNVNDPYNYSQRSYIIALTNSGNDTKPFADCTAVTVSIEEVSESSAPAVVSGWNTTTAYTTVTDYTTYCPESTVVTVTTCENNACGEHVVTVTEATTLTVTGECVVAKTSAPSTTLATSTAAKTSEAVSTVAAVSSFNGAAQNAIGLTGLAAVAALLL